MVHCVQCVVTINISEALALDGVYGVLTGAELLTELDPLASAVRAPADFFPIAKDKVRYVGEPVAVIAAVDRYVAEDALDRIVVDYDPLPAAVDPVTALDDDAGQVHEMVGSNLVHHRTFRYGDPERAFAEAANVVELEWRYPRQASTPIETYGVVAHFETAPERYTIWSNFQGQKIFIFQNIH